MNQMKYYVDAEGVYLGGWDANPPAGAIEVPTPPDDARQKWDGETWSEVPAPEPEPEEILRQAMFDEFVERMATNKTAPAAAKEAALKLKAKKNDP